MRCAIVIPIALIGAIASTPALAELCRVADPTGTPLNVRTAPNAKIIRTLRNGTYVEIEQVVTGPDRKRWAFVIQPDTGAAFGWVFRDYLICNQ